MLQPINDLPAGIIGVEAHDKIVKDDYERVLVPMLDAAYQQGSKVRFLYHFTPDFTGFSIGAAWDDLYFGMRYLRLLERCAVVTDSDAIANSTRLASFLLPCPVKVFQHAELQTAIGWLSVAELEPSLHAQLIADRGILMLEPQRALTRDDFAHVAAIVDPWIEANGQLNGIVLRARRFPGWENFGALLRHLRFVRDHHKQVRRIAVVTDGLLMELLPKLGGHFVNAEVKTFHSDQLDAAMAWAGGVSPRPVSDHGAQAPAP